MKLTKIQKAFLNGIKDDKTRLEQRTQFKLSNTFLKENGAKHLVKEGFVIANGKNPCLSNHLMNVILFKEELYKKLDDHYKKMDLGESINAIQNPNTPVKEEIDCKDKTWYETQLEDTVEKFKKAGYEVILSHTPMQLYSDAVSTPNQSIIPTKSLTKEVLNDLTNPKPENDERILNQETNQWIRNAENIPLEFCVEITEDNKDILEKIREEEYNVVNPLIIGNYFLSNIMKTYFLQLKFNFIQENKEPHKIVSTEEFLKYIGKEDLIETNFEIKDRGTPPEEYGYRNGYKKSLLEYNQHIFNCIKQGSDPTNILNKYLIMVQKYYYFVTKEKIDFITELFPQLK